MGREQKGQVSTISKASKMQYGFLILVYLVLLAEFGGKGERQKMNFEGLTPSHFLGRTLGADIRNNYGFISGEIMKGDRIDPVDRI